MKHILKRMISLSMVVIIAIGALAGCSGKDTAAKAETEAAAAETGAAAMGRYLEEEIPLPKDTVKLLAMGEMEDKSLRAAALCKEEMGIYDSSDLGVTWNKVMDIPSELYDAEKQTFLERVVLMPDGSLACTVNDYTAMMADQENGKIKSSLWILSKDGKANQIPIELKEDDVLDSLALAGDNQVIGAARDGKLHLIDTVKGESIRTFDTADNYIVSYTLAGNTLVVLSRKGITLFDVTTGKNLEKDTVLNDEIMKNDSNIEFESSNSYPVLMQASADGKGINYCTSDGVFTHILNGNVTEQLIDGNLTSLSNPSVGLAEMRQMKDGSFLVSTVGEDSLCKVYRYVYSKDTPTVPATELKAYTLEDNPEIRQVIALFQKKYPDIRVTLEIGISGDNSVTVSDALKTLNTNMIAGNGPDLLIMDGISIDSYIEKGLLADLAGPLNLISKEDGMNENIKNTYAKDGKIYAVPSRFSIPIIQGTKDTVDAVSDLKSLVDTAEQLKGKDPSKRVLSEGNTSIMIKNLYDICASAWVKEDKTLDESLLKEFFTQVKRLYDLDEHQNEKEGGAHFNNEALSYGIGNCLLEYYSKALVMNFGAISSMEVLAELCSANKTLQDGSTFKPLNLQAQKVFIPSTIMGVSSKAENRDVAEKFVAFMLSKDTQSVSQGSGFPVNSAALDKLLSEKAFEDGQRGIVSTDEAGNTVDLEINWPSAEELKTFGTYLDAAQTPADTNKMMKDIVLEMADKCVKGETTVDDAVNTVLQKLNLYLAE